MSDNYVTNAFFSGTGSVLAGIFIFLGGIVVGEGLFLVIQTLLSVAEGGDFYAPDVAELFLGMIGSVLFAFFFGAASGIGIIFILINFWFIYRLLYADESIATFFLVIAMDQAALTLCASLVAGRLSENGLSCLLALVILGLLFWAAKWWQRKQEIDAGIGVDPKKPN